MAQDIFVSVVNTGLDFVSVRYAHDPHTQARRRRKAEYVYSVRPLFPLLSSYKNRKEIFWKKESKPPNCKEKKMRQKPGRPESVYRDAVHLRHASP
jgi:hypothetical protein